MEESCFVIQPFSPADTKRFDEVYSVAINNAGLEPYRVDRDPAVMVPADSIEIGIRSAKVCLADITGDNPNVWLEIGYAMALEKPIVFVSNKARESLPFDIQHKNVTYYETEAPTDFERAGAAITDRLLSIGFCDKNISQQVDDAPSPF